MQDKTRNSGISFQMVIRAALLKNENKNKSEKYCKKSSFSKIPEKHSK